VIDSPNRVRAMQRLAVPNATRVKSGGCRAEADHCADRASSDGDRDEGQRARGVCVS
jgi:hypothetical protein